MVYEPECNLNYAVWLNHPMESCQDTGSNLLGHYVAYLHELDNDKDPREEHGDFSVNAC